MSKNSKNILVVEDEQSISDSIAYVLKSEGLKPYIANTADEAKRMAGSESFIAGIFDIGLPDMSGFELFREIRSIQEFPVIFLTARAEEVDRVVGLEMGADDYITKPFSPRELAARIKVILRRYSQNSSSNSSSQRLSIGNFTLNESQHSVKYFNKDLELTRYEYRLLLVFLKSPGRVYSREHLMSLAWEEPDMSLERTVDTHVKVIRSKLKAINNKQDPLVTHRGVGYSLKID
jgi:two-component system, OmpR family, catabolic regulation response regulator CreB